jgi:hypothetical protein
LAHPQLFRSMLRDEPTLHFPVEVSHPPVIILERDMAIVKMILAGMSTIGFLLVVTIAYVYIRASRTGAKVIGVDVLRLWTVYSPMYWILMVAVLAVLTYLFWHWAFGR